MSTLQWSETLESGLSFMDDTHHEFVDLLATVVNADDAQLLGAWQALVDHTDGHFSREDRWMQDTRFSSTNCHTTQHQVVLQVMREGVQRGQVGELAVIRQMAYELGIWFPHHAQSMDAALALHLRSVGYDPLTGQVLAPQALPNEVLHGCSGVTCSTPKTEATLATTELEA